MKTKNSFINWIIVQRGRDDEVGKLARDACNDLEWTGGMMSLRQKAEKENRMQAYITMTDEFRSQKKSYTVTSTIRPQLRDDD